MDPPILKFLDPNLDLGHLKLIKIMMCWTQVFKKAGPTKNADPDLAMQSLILGLFCRG